jgi:hypothetical protein
LNQSAVKSANKPNRPTIAHSLRCRCHG